MNNSTSRLEFMRNVNYKDIKERFKNQLGVHNYTINKEDFVGTFKILVCKNEGNKDQFFAIEAVEEAKLGESLSPVYSGINLRTGELVAVKALQNSIPSAMDDLVRERKNLIIKKELCGTAIEGDETNRIYYSVMKKYPGDNLINLLYEIDANQKKDSSAYYKAKKNLSFATKIQLTKGVISELNRLHTEFKLIHRDVKTANFLDATRVERHLVSLIDLGSGVEEWENSGNLIEGSKGYIPPEYLLKPGDRPAKYDYSYDKWALAAVIAEIWTNCNYQACILNHTSDQLSAEDVKSYMKDVFSNELGFENEQEKEDWKHISRIISGLMDEDPDWRLALSTAQNVMTKINSRITVKPEIEHSIPKIGSEEDLRISGKARIKSFYRKTDPGSSKRDTLDLPPLQLNDISLTHSNRPNTAREQSSKKEHGDALKHSKTEQDLSRLKKQRARTKSHGAQDNKIASRGSMLFGLSLFTKNSKHEEQPQVEPITLPISTETRRLRAKSQGDLFVPSSEQLDLARSRRFQETHPAKKSGDGIHSDATESQIQQDNTITSHI